MTTLFARALLPDGHPNAIGAKLRLTDLCRLRASSHRATDQVLFSQLLEGMRNQVAAGLLEVETVIVEGKPTGEYLVTETADDPRRWAPNQMGKEIVLRCTFNGSKPPVGAVPALGPETVEHWLSKQQALAAFAIDPEDWSEGAKRWAGILPAEPVKTVQSSVPALSPVTVSSPPVIDDLSTTSNAVTYVFRELEPFGYTESQIKTWLDKPVRVPGLKEAKRGHGRFSKSAALAAIQAMPPADDTIAKKKRRLMESAN